LRESRARDKVARLGLAHLFLELQQVILDTEVYLMETKDANGGAVVREAVDKSLEDATGWESKKTGDVDWVKRARYNETIISRIGVELQVSSRSDLVVRDLVHLRNRLQKGDIDIGVIIVPSDRMRVFLPDRTPSFRDAVRYVEGRIQGSANLSNYHRCD
jgi:restriction endonuclease BglII